MCSPTSTRTGPSSSLARVHSRAFPPPPAFYLSRAHRVLPSTRKPGDHESDPMLNVHPPNTALPRQLPRPPSRSVFAPSLQWWTHDPARAHAQSHAGSRPKAPQRGRYCSRRGMGGLGSAHTREDQIPSRRRASITARRRQPQYVPHHVPERAHTMIRFGEPPGLRGRF
ncbi:hypothetical protein BD413DRAFT_74577 [Trametes elegans]|nr:hypothetical protein BD413DRAFT_74577 [Trametes elegans]